MISCMTRAVGVLWLLMTLIIAALVLLGLAVLGGAFVMNARAIRRDFTTRFDALRTRLEDDANALLTGILNADSGDADTAARDR